MPLIIGSKKMLPSAPLRRGSLSLSPVREGRSYYVSACQSTTSSSTSSTTTMTGWGSAASRQSYASLASLAAETDDDSRRVVAAADRRESAVEIDNSFDCGETWGYFVDVASQ
eukprot:CAMPEP_0197442220 /NCGR_PEP_ID=MMETSP1175-20131217/8286_1 /TAXON_ID=1003142 /ORGANISM="Triceratium dubium, Strain CCMP147" /LENGTH=112 /DNA_ID=CAMNT_0042972649 /DNA_START=248 /DNA_END=586 /DNA_ORIENTATION=-